MDTAVGTCSETPDLSQLVDSKKYECVYDGCKRSYTSMGNLKTHLKAHQGRYDYRCDHDNCDKAFLSSYSLKVHRRIHTGEKPYSCESDGCDKSFNTLYRLNAHKRIHTGKLFDCEFDTCSKQFTTKSDLRKHTRTHSGEKPYQCKIDGCSKAYKAPHHLRTHAIKHQPKDTMAPSSEGIEEGSGLSESCDISTESHDQHSNVNAESHDISTKSHDQHPNINAESHDISTESHDQLPNISSGPLDILSAFTNSPASQQLLEALYQESMSSLVPSPGQATSDSNHVFSNGPPPAIITSLANDVTSSTYVPNPSHPVSSNQSLSQQQANPTAGQTHLNPPISSSPVPPPLSTHPLPMSLPAQLKLASEISDALRALQVLSQSGTLQSLLTLSQLQNPSTTAVPPLTQFTSGTTPSLPATTNLSGHPFNPTPLMSEPMTAPHAPSLNIDPHHAFLPPISTGSHDIGAGSHDYPSGAHDYQLLQSMHTFPHSVMVGSDNQPASTSSNMDTSVDHTHFGIPGTYDDYLDHGTQTLPIDLDALLPSPYPSLEPLVTSTASVLGHTQHQMTVLSPANITPQPFSSVAVVKVDQASQTDASISCSSDLSCCTVAVKSEKCSCCGCCSCDCLPCAKR